MIESIAGFIVGWLTCLLALRWTHPVRPPGELVTAIAETERRRLLRAVASRN